MKHSIADLKGAFKRVGLLLKEDLYLGYSVPHAYECKTCGHRGAKSPNEAFSNKSGCWACGRKRAASSRKYSPDKIQKICKKWNVRLIDYPETLSQKIRLVFIRCGHEQLKSLEAIQGGRSGCSVCSGMAPKTQKDYLTVANQYKGKLIELAAGSKMKARWKCRLGHYFERSLQNIVADKTFCTVCTQNSLAERLAHTVLEKLFGRPFVKIRIPNSKSLRGRTLEVDLYNKDLKLAVEIHGPQHYKPVDFHGRGIEDAKQKLEILKENDRRTRLACKNQGIALLEVRELGTKTSLSQFRDLLAKKCQTFGIPIPASFWSVNLDEIQPTSGEGRYWDMVVTKAASWGLVPVSNRYTRSIDNHWWNCSNGCRVQMRPRDIATDRVKGCPGCWKKSHQKAVSLSDGRIFASGAAAARALGLNRNSVNMAIYKGSTVKGLSVRRV
jgi:hypothetical protein